MHTITQGHGEVSLHKVNVPLSIPCISYIGSSFGRICNKWGMEIEELTELCQRVEKAQRFKHLVLGIYSANRDFV